MSTNPIDSIFGVQQIDTNLDGTTTTTLIGSGFIWLHLFLSIFALYLCFRCHGEFKLLPFLAALFFPYFYIPYALAITCKDTTIMPRW